MASKLLTRISVWNLKNNSYEFGSLNLHAPTNYFQNIYYWQINQAFGLLYMGESNASNIVQSGKSGDYVYLDPSTGALSILSKEIYEHRFPATVYNTAAASTTITSTKLQENPQKYTTPGYNISKGGGSYTQTGTSPTPSSPSSPSTGGAGGY